MSSNRQAIHEPAQGDRVRKTVVLGLGMTRADGAMMLRSIYCTPLIDIALR